MRVSVEGLGTSQLYGHYFAHLGITVERKDFRRSRREIQEQTHLQRHEPWGRGRPAGWACWCDMHLKAPNGLTKTDSFFSWLSTRFCRPPPVRPSVAPFFSIRGLLFSSGALALLRLCQSSFLVHFHHRCVWHAPGCTKLQYVSVQAVF